MCQPTQPSDLPPIAGREANLLALMQQSEPLWTSPSDQSMAFRTAFGCALHMHQPTIPAGADGALISHLQYMVEHPGEADNHNAEPFAWCYRRMADLIPQLLAEGCRPRIMLDYSGNLLWGIQQMGRHDILEALRHLSGDPTMQRHVEWLGSFWSHAVAPSTPIRDLKRQILAWQHHFAALFGDAALQRVRGFSLPEMHLPNHPDSHYALIRALQECGYRWLLVQEHSVERLDGTPLAEAQKYRPNRLVARNSNGETATMVALIKTQGSDTKLVGQMQPCYEAMSLARQPQQESSIPPLVMQIADGENGGVMMNEFPAAFVQAHRTIAGQTDTAALNGSEYLALLQDSGFNPDAYPEIQPVHQHRLWQQLGATRNPQAVNAAIAGLKASDPSFSMDGGSWTNNLSWVEGYATVLEPMEELSEQFHQTFDAAVAGDPTITATADYQQALLHLLLGQTSCFRYWGEGRWTDYAREIHRRGMALLQASR